MRTNLLISGIFNIIISLFWLLGLNSGNEFCVLAGAFLIVSGIVLISYSKLNIKDINAKKGIILTFAIFLLPFNFVSAIILLIDSDSIGRDYKKYLNSNPAEVIENTNSEKQVISKEVRKVDSLLKIGVVMVAIAGAMIATTSWELITDFVKMILMLIIGIMFWGLSKFSEIKLKIKNTTLAYWLLAMISFLLATFVVGYGALLGDWFSFDGEGELVYISVFLLIISLLSYATYKKFSFVPFIYLTYICLISSILFIIAFLSTTIEVCILTIAIILFIINVLPKIDNKEVIAIKKFGLVSTYVLTGLIVIELSDIAENIIMAIGLIIHLINLIVLAIKEKSEITKILSSIGVILLTSITINNLLVDADEIFALIITRGAFIIMTGFVCWAVIKDEKTSNVLLSIVLPLALLSMIEEVNIIVGLFVGTITVIMIIFGYVFKDFKTIYVEGIVFTILNLIVQLSDFWGQIPIWVYLLISGLVLIGIVTVKELKKSDNE